MNQSMTKAPMWSLGYFTLPPPNDPTPRTRQAVFWEAKFQSWLAERLAPGARMDFDVRSPLHIWSIARQSTLPIRKDDARDWHHDGPLRSQYVGVWSNTLGTEIKRAAKRARKIYQGEPNEFLLFDNAFFKHRPPQDTTEEERAARWFVRLYTSGPLQKHPDILRCLLP